MLTCLLFTLVGHAQEANVPVGVPVEIQAAIQLKFNGSRPDLKILAIKISPIAGLYEVNVLNGPVLYATADGTYFILGEILEATLGGFVNLAEKDREGMRSELLAALKEEDMIIFSPEEQPAKARITVFTDVDCGFCQKLHREVPDLNRIGIEVRYLAFPRAGIGSDAYNKIASAWCADDPKKALTTLKNRRSIPINVCPQNPVAEQYRLGQKMGVSGTPALIMDSGRLLPGYMPALRLADTLGVAVDPDLAKELKAKEQL
jgi:thiol:disulfide interchange protein DsbC